MKKHVPPGAFAGLRATPGVVVASSLRLRARQFTNSPQQVPNGTRKPIVVKIDLIMSDSRRQHLKQLLTKVGNDLGVLKVSA